MVLHGFTSFLGGVPLCIPYGLYSGTSLGETTRGTLEGYPGRVLLLIVYLIYSILFLISYSLQVSYTFMFISFHVHILCMYHILSYLVYFHITYLILSYTFIYILILFIYGTFVYFHLSFTCF